MREADITAIARALEGSGDAYKELVDRHSRPLFRLAFRMTGNEQDAEDVVQEALLRAFKNLNRYESRCCFSTWLHRIAANCALDLIRRRRPTEEINDQGTIEARPGPERLSISAQVQSVLAQTMKELSPQERTAFALRHYDNQPIQEIAEALGLSQGAVKHSVFRAVQKLRQALAPVAGRDI